MREQLIGYIPYQIDEYKEILKNALVIVDTNVILNFYRYSSNTRNELLGILEDVKDRLWMPYQVCMEYSKNRENVIERVETSLTKVKEDIAKQFNSFTTILQKIDKKEFKSKEEIIKVLNEASEKIKKMVEEEEKEQEHFSDTDIVLDKLLQLYDGRCGHRVQNEELEKIKKEAKRRNENKIPPGYCDKDKEENYGDYYIFYEIINRAKEEKKNVIFITDDEKEDWYLIRNGKKKGGRPELLREFYDNTNQLLFICNTTRFIKQYNEYCRGYNTPNNLIEEIENISKRNEKLDMPEIYNTKRSLQKNGYVLLIMRLTKMKKILEDIQQERVKIEEAFEKIESQANAILENIRYEQFHGKIIVLVDELEKEKYKVAIHKAIGKIDNMIWHIKYMIK